MTLETISKRLEKIEHKATGVPLFRMASIDCTASEYDAMVAYAESQIEPDESLWVVSFAPFQGQSMNEHRQSLGMTAMDIEGWDDRTPITGPEIEISPRPDSKDRTYSQAGLTGKRQPVDLS